MKRSHFSGRIQFVLIPALLCLGMPMVRPDSPQAVKTAKALQEEAGMVLLPGGDFQMGHATGKDRPVHAVSVSAFWIDKYEVTNAQYFEFCKAVHHPLPEFWGQAIYHCGLEWPDHPVVGVSWQSAKDYAAWCGKRLPTEAEWEYAARGGLTGKDFPNGDELDVKTAVFNPSRGTMPAGSFPANGFGLFDMAGNVVEWVEDYYSNDYYLNGPSANPPGPAEGKFRVIRGGGWHSGSSCCRVFQRNGLPSGWVDIAVGFRCAKSLPGR